MNECGVDRMIWHEDSGHAWLEVPKKLINDLGLSEKISHYSYMKGKFAYLEEDCDATLFLETLKAKMNMSKEFFESFVRSLAIVRYPKDCIVRTYLSYNHNL